MIAVFVLMTVVSGVMPGFVFAVNPEVLAGKAATGNAGSTYIDGQIFVQIKEKSEIESFHEVVRSEDMKILVRLPGMRSYLLSVSDPVEAAVAYMQSLPFTADVQPNYIVAEIEDEYVTLMDVRRAIAEAPLFLQQHYANDNAKKALLNSLIDYKLFAKAAKADKVDELPEVKQHIDGVVEKTLAKLYEGRMYDQVSVSEDEIEEYYKSHIGEFQIREQVKVSHIVAGTVAEAAEVREFLMAGKNFDDVVAEKAGGSTVRPGMKLGWFGRGRMSPEFEKAAFALNIGEISSVVHVDSGYHIIRLDDRKSPGVRHISEVRGRIALLLKDEKQKKYINKKRRELRSRYRVVSHNSLLSAVKVHATGKIRQKDILESLQKAIQVPQ